MPETMTNDEYAYFVRYVEEVEAEHKCYLRRRELLKSFLAAGFTHADWDELTHLHHRLYPSQFMADYSKVIG